MIDVGYIDRKSDDYINKDMTVDINMGCIELNWRPRTFCRFLRFVRYLKFKTDSYHQFYDSNKPVNQNIKHSNQLSQCKEDCQKNPQILMSVKALIETLKIKCLHPNNYTYPIFSIVLSSKTVKYDSKFDHDEIEVNMDDLQLIDHTNYPNTLDVDKIYTVSDRLEKQDIMSGNMRAHEQGIHLMKVSIIMFHKPLERSCPIAQQEDNKTFDKLISITMESIKLHYLQEYIFRIQDYFFYQLIGAASDTNPYYHLSEQAKEDFFQCQKQKHAINLNKDDKLQQHPYCTGLNIEARRPTIIIRDRPYNKFSEIKINFASLKISNETGKCNQRWQLGDQEVLTTTMTIVGNRFTMGYEDDEKTQQFLILMSTNFEVKLTNLNYTEILVKSYKSENINFEELDISQHIEVKFDKLSLEFTQEIYTYLLRCNDLNFSHYDNMSQQFQLSIWNDPDFMKLIKLAEDIKDMYKGNTKVYRQKLKMSMPSFSISLKEKNESTLIGEIVLWNYEFEMKKFVDYRCDITITAHSIQILRKEHNKIFTKNQEQMKGREECKALIMGHQSAHNYLFTDQNYYLFEPDKIIPRINKSISKASQKARDEAKQMLQQKHFNVKICMIPTGERQFNCTLTQHKVIMNVTVFLSIQNFFMKAFPDYSNENDKPYYYQKAPDPNNAKKREYMLKMDEGLICFENEGEDKFIVCQCSLIVDNLQETINEIKQKLLDDAQQKLMEPHKSIDYNDSEKTGIFLISLSQFGLYILDAKDLDGFQFENVNKRQLMQPINMHFNKQSMIQLNFTSDGEILKQVEFSSFQRVNAFVDRTQLQITLHDMLTIKKIADYNLKMLTKFEMEQQEAKILPIKSKTRNDSIESNSEDSDSSFSLNKSNTQKRQKEMYNEIGYQTPQPKSKILQPIEPLQLNKSQLEDQNRKSFFNNFVNTLKRSSKSLFGQQEKVFQAESMSNFNVQNKPRDTVYYDFSEIQINQIQVSGIKEVIEGSSNSESSDSDQSSNNSGEQSDCPDPREDEVNISLNSRMNVVKTLRVTTLSQRSQSLMSESEQNSEEEIFRFFQRQSIRVNDFIRFKNERLIQAIFQKEGHDSLVINSNGMLLLFINDNNDNFLPVLAIQLSDFNGSHEHVDSVMMAKTVVSSQMSYFNVYAGSWEPALERFETSLEIVFNKDGSANIQLQIKNEININLSESLLKILHQTTKSIYQVQKEILSQNKKKEDVSKGLICGNFIQFKVISGENSSLMNRSTEIIVSPYAICNMTDENIQIERLVQPNNLRMEQELLKKEQTHLGRRSSISLSAILARRLSEQTQYSGINQQIQKKNDQKQIVLIVEPNQTANLEINYQNQVNQHVQKYEDCSKKSKEIVSVTFEIPKKKPRKAPIEDVNLNKLGQVHRHYFQSEEYKEFLVYSVTFKNLKRVLTIRTQYVLQNLTLEEYNVRVITIFNKQIVKEISLLNGQIMPLPEIYNDCYLNVKLKKDTQWSEPLKLFAIKNIIKPNQAGYLKHDCSFTLFRKVEAECAQAYNINLMPPLALKNCLPCDLFLQYVDFQNKLCKLTLAKEDVKNVFQFDNQRKIKISVQISGYNPTTLDLDMIVELQEEQKYQFTLEDSDGHKLLIQYSKSSKKAGFAINFYLTNCLINQAQQNLQFFYNKPSRGKIINEYDHKNMVSNPFEIEISKDPKLNQKLYLLQNCQKLWAKFEGAGEVSDEIFTFTPGVNCEFHLQKNNRLYEYGCITGIYLANKEEFIYTKITTISPLYMVLNLTKSTILFAQTSVQKYHLEIKPGKRFPFHWSDYEQEIKLVSVKLVPNEEEKAKKKEYDWSTGFVIKAMGTLIVQNRQKKEESQMLKHMQSWQITNEEKTEQRPVDDVHSIKKFLRISRQYIKHQIFVQIEEADDISAMIIKNNFKKISIVYQQKDNTDVNEIDFVQPGQIQAFTWSDQSDPNRAKMLTVQLFKGDYTNSARKLNLRDTSFESKIKNSSIEIQLDELNSNKKKIIIDDKDFNQKYFYTVITNGQSKILQFEEEKSGLQIKNDLQDITITIQQQQINGSYQPYEKKYVYPKKMIDYIWVDEYGESKLQIQLKQVEQLRIYDIKEDRENDYITVRLDEFIEQRQDAFYIVNKHQQVQFYYQMSKDQNIVTLRFFTQQQSLSSTALTIQTTSSENVKNILHVNISQVIFSLIAIDRELLTVHMKGISLDLESSDTTLVLSNRLQQFQIDNQCERDPIYPVMLKQVKQINEEQGNQSVNDVFQFHCNMRTDMKNVLYFDELKFLLQHLELKLELSHLVLLAEFGTRVGKFLKTNLNVQHKIFQAPATLSLDERQRQDENLKQEIDDQLEKLQDFLERRQKKQDRNLEEQLGQRKFLTQEQFKNYRTTIISYSNHFDEKLINSAEEPKEELMKSQKIADDEEEQISHTPIQKIYIKEFQGSPIWLNVSLIKYGVSPEDEQSDLSLFKTIGSMGLSISTFENAPIRIKTIIHEHLFGEKDEVLQWFQYKYIQMIKENGITFLGASNLIGNPVNLINTLGMGFREFVSEPYKGFQQGGAQAVGDGIVRGANSLVKNTLVGTVGSFGKITSSLSAGVLALAGDNQFNQKRTMDMIRGKPRNVVDGLKKGLVSALSSGWSGIQDIVDKPSEGYLESGTSGLFKGAIKGAAGLFVKPISGAIDLVVKTSEGIENSWKTKEELIEGVRLRNPRAFYEEEHVFREYDIVHADILNVLPRLMFYQPDQDKTLVYVDTTVFYDAWVINQNSEAVTGSYWDVLVIVSGQVVRIKQFVSLQDLRAEQQLNHKLKHQGNSLIQILSVNKISEINQISSYKTMLDLDFEDGREIFDFQNEKVLEAVVTKVKQLLKQHKAQERALNLKQQRYIFNNQETRLYQQKK